MISHNDDTLMRRIRDTAAYKEGYINRHSTVIEVMAHLKKFETNTDPMPALVHAIGSLIKAYEENADIRCMVLNCENRRSQGAFVGDLCKPCHEFITNSCGTNNQVYRNAVKAAYSRLIGD